MNQVVFIDLSPLCLTYKTWSGTIDRILGIQDCLWTVQDLESGVQRTHSTQLETRNIRVDSVLDTEYAVGTPNIDGVLKALLDKGVKPSMLEGAEAYLANASANTEVPNIISLLKRFENGDKGLKSDIAHQLTELLCPNPYGKAARLLRDAGYPIKCLERDSFGWLMGGLITEKGVIPFG